MLIIHPRIRSTATPALQCSFKRTIRPNIPATIGYGNLFPCATWKAAQFNPGETRPVPNPTCGHGRDWPGAPVTDRERGGCRAMGGASAPAALYSENRDRKRSFSAACLTPCTSLCTRSSSRICQQSQLGPVNTTGAGGAGSRFFRVQGATSDGYRVSPSEEQRGNRENRPRPEGLR